MAGRKILGSLLIVLIGLPVLFGMIWAVGLVRATVSSEFLSDLPRKIIADIPASIDDVFAATESESRWMDESARAWMRAARETGIRPGELMEKTGMLGWLQGELSSSLSRVGGIMRGEAPIEPIMIDMRPLKAALLHPEMDRFFESLVQFLPPCDDQGLKAWENRLSAGFVRFEDLPACRPADMVAAQAALHAERTREVEKMDDSVQVFDDVESYPFGRVGISRAVSTLSYLLFLFPALIILCGVLLANRTSAGRMRWGGISILAGSLPVVLMALLLKRVVGWAAGGRWMHWSWGWRSDWDTLLMDKLGWIPERIMSALFTPVFNTAVVVAVIGVVLVALSYSTRQAAPAAPPQA